ncbi:unnamed protein product [Adineta ricciae]|uniref:Uncharacterized protein n=1 Tax=Adineta ricciae TaxID=249248 RepID=A0A816A0H6_ADIRI|nr:unnamed protein product [Adineta ricciae]CAF1589369.1 unnamed protein product [Adineta ricciae]
MARSVPAGSSNVGSRHCLTVSCKLRAGNGQELIRYFLCNSGGKEPAGIGENCAGIDSDFNSSSRRNDRPGNMKTTKMLNPFRQEKKIGS